MELEEVLNKIKRHKVKSIILFGSYVRGMESEDVDILVVSEKPLNFDFGEKYDVIVIPEQEIEDNSRRFKYALKKDGVVVYGQNPFALSRLGDPSLKDAYGFLDDTVIEINRSEKENSERLARKAAESIFHAFVEATSYLFEKKNYSIPNNHRETMDQLRELEEKIPRLKAVSDFYQELFNKLHVEVWYRGRTPSREEIFSYRDKTRSLVDKISEISNSNL